MVGSDDSFPFGASSAYFQGLIMLVSGRLYRYEIGGFSMAMSDYR